MNARSQLVLITTIILVASCFSVALPPTTTYDDALALDLRSKPCTTTVTRPEELSNIANAAQQGMYFES